MKKNFLTFLIIFPVFTFAAGLSGTYTIGGGGNFNTISLAINQLIASGVSGPVIFNLTDKFYNEQLDFKQAITGASSTNTITFQTDIGSSQNAEIYYTATNSSNNFVVRIDEAAHLIFKNITFSANGSSYARVIVSEKPMGYLTFDGNIFNGLANSTSGLEKSNVYIIANSSTYNVNNINFSNNAFNDGLYGIYAESFNSPNSLNCTISNNTFNSNYVGIRLENFDAPKIVENIFNSNDYRGISLVSCSNNFTVEKNKINSTAFSSIGILLTTSNGNSLKYGLLLNNFVQSTGHGIRLINTDYVEIYFNSVNIINNPNTPLSTTSAINQDANSSNLFIHNNILLNEREGYAFIGNSGAGLSINNNDLFTNGTNLAQWNGADYTNFASFVSTSGTNNNSFNLPVIFNSISDLHVKSSPTPLFGIEIAFITNDIDGDSRSIVPSIGADEYISPLSGTYSIGNFKDFTNISEAISALYTNGISSETVFNIDPGIYNEQLDFNGNIYGTNNSNTISFQGLEGTPDINFSSTSSGNNYVLRINELQHVSFNNLIFTASGTQYSRVVLIENPKGNISFNNNIFYGYDGGSSLTEQVLIYGKSLSSINNFSNYSFLNNTFYYGTYGIYLETYYEILSDNIQIENNEFNTSTAAIYLTYSDAPIINANTIKLKELFSAIVLSSCENDFVISNNKISSQTNTGDVCNGIWIINTNNSPGSLYGLVKNNFIQATQEGITVINSSKIEFYFNTVNIEQPGISANFLSYSIKLNSDVNNIFVYNNIFINKRSGPAYIGFSGTHESNYNNLFANGVNIANWDNTNYHSITSFKSASGTNTNSLNEEVFFTAFNDLHIANVSVILNGVEIPSITDDIDGDFRNNPPKMGADEYLSFLSGTYTIGLNSDFPTIASAVLNLYQSEITGPVTFNILNGNYNEQIDLNGAIAGTNIDNTITFQSSSGNAEDVEIYYSADSEANNYVVRIEETKYINFNNLTFSATGLQYASVVRSYQNHGEIIFNGNVFNGLPNANVNSALIYLINNSPVGADNITITNNTFNYGAVGISIGSSPDYRTQHVSITDNIFNENYVGINLLSCSSPNISNNILKTSRMGIETYSCTNINVANNQISSKNFTDNMTGLKVSFSSGSAAKIYNNFIQSLAKGIEISNSSSITLYYNTVSIDDNYTLQDITSKALEISANSNLNIYNNILINKRDGYSYYSGSGTNISSNYNNLFTTGSILSFSNGSNRATLHDFQTANNSDANSYNADVFFVLTGDLHIVGSSEILMGTIFPEISEDIDGEPRNNPPFLGADEPILTQVSAKIFLEGPYNGSNNMNTSLNNSIPLQQPYSAPIHNGTESVASSFFSTHSNIVDWIVVELRLSETEKLTTRAGFLLNTGYIVDLDGSSPLKFIIDPQTNYSNLFIVVYHRNHLPVMSGETF